MLNPGLTRTLTSASNHLLLTYTYTPPPPTLPPIRISGCLPPFLHLGACHRRPLARRRLRFPAAAAHAAAGHARRSEGFGARASLRAGKAKVRPPNITLTRPLLT